MLSSRSALVVLVVFFNIRLVHSEFVSQDQTANTTLYYDVLKCLRRTFSKNNLNCGVMDDGLFKIRNTLLKV